ncbi:hypothetical protein PIB30_050521, partial [Stylosanthes scabra]|nr:hypothetical protein [Stylosanthes scabra]
KKAEGRSRVDRDADNLQLQQLEEKDVVSSVATVLSDLCGPGEWMPMEKLHAELVEQYNGVWHHSRVRRYLTSEDWPGPESKGKPWYGLLMLLRKYPEHFVINTRSKGRVTLEISHNLYNTHGRTGNSLTRTPGWFGLSIKSEVHRSRTDPVWIRRGNPNFINSNSSLNSQTHSRRTHPFPHHPLVNLISLHLPHFLTVRHRPFLSVGQRLSCLLQTARPLCRTVAFLRVVFFLRIAFFLRVCLFSASPSSSAPSSFTWMPDRTCSAKVPIVVLVPASQWDRANSSTSDPSVEPLTHPSVEFRQKYAELAVNFATLDIQEMTSSFIRASTPQDDVVLLCKKLIDPFSFGLKCLKTQVTCDDILTLGVLEHRSGTSTRSHCFVEIDEVITFVYHHGGTLVTKDDGEVVYEMEEITEQPNEEVDTLDVFAIRNHHKVLGYDKIEVCYWLVPGRSLSNGLRALITDNELLDMRFYAKRNERRIHIYYEHAVSVPNPVEECPKLI